jgi:Uma2 family endonuclease
MIDGAMMSMVIETILTPEEFLRLPDSVAFELVDGQLVERNVSALSSCVAMRIGHLLGAEISQSAEAYVFGPDLSYQCFEGHPSRIRCADVSVIRKSRLANLEAGLMAIPADLAVEVLSPNDLSYDVNEKVEQYLDAGFGLVWVVDPNARIVHVHRRDGSVAKLHEKDEITGESALPSFRCKVAEFFRR